MRYPRIIGIVFAALATALILQIAIFPRGGLKTWRMTAKPVAIPAVVRSLRPVYPYSVIPGGVYSAEELGLARSKDRLVREHYADFNLTATHLVTTAEERYAYVSYRLGGRLLWTQHKLRIPKGETLLTDGVNFCRTRCGNRLSEFPHREISAIEPSYPLLSLPNFKPSLFADNLVGLDTPMVESAAVMMPFKESRLAPVMPSSAAAYFSASPSVQWTPMTLVGIPLPAIYAPQPNPKKVVAPFPTSPSDEPSAISAVPEPGTLVLGLLALVGVYGAALLRKRTAHR